MNVITTSTGSKLKVLKMSRFKKLTPVPGGGGDEVSAEIALGNDLHYKQLVPQVGVGGVV